MQLEVGMIVEGKVTGITNFGAFVDLPGNKTGMVHISEVAPTYVKEIKDHLQEGQIVKVKILKVDDGNKISLSIKMAMEQTPAEKPNKPIGRPNSFSRPSRPGFSNFDSKNKRDNNSEPDSFENMMSRFKKSSDEKFSDLKKGNESRRGSRRGNGSQK